MKHGKSSSFPSENAASQSLSLRVRLRQATHMPLGQSTSGPHGEIWDDVSPGGILGRSQGMTLNTSLLKKMMLGRLTDSAKTLWNRTFPLTMLSAKSLQVRHWCPNSVVPPFIFRGKRISDFRKKHLPSLQTEPHLQGIGFASLLFDETGTGPRGRHFEEFNCWWLPNLAIYPGWGW